MSLNYLFILFVGRFITLQCEGKFYVYSSEDGKRISTFPFDNATLSCCSRWIKMLNDDFTMILALIDFTHQSIKWSVNCEFELKGSLNVKEKEDDQILDVQIDKETNDIFVSMNTGKILKINFPFKDSFLSKLSKVSKQLQLLLRCVDEVKGQFQKLLKLEELVLVKVSEIETGTLQRLILFGSNSRETIESIHSLKDSDILEWKSKLKKLHVELLVSIQELSINSIEEDFCFEIVDKFMNSSLKDMENQSRTLQHELAEILIWLEALIIDKITMKPFSSQDERNLKLLKRFQRIESCGSDSLLVFDQFKLTLDEEFRSFISKINLMDLDKVNEIEKPLGFDRILLVNPFILLLNDDHRIHLISSDFKVTKSINLPDEYISHYSIDFKAQVVIICKGLVQVTINKDMSIEYERNEECDYDKVFNYPSSNQLYTTSISDLCKLSIYN